MQVWASILVAAVVFLPAARVCEGDEVPREYVLHIEGMT
jgi:hypothetical protein